MCNNQIFQQALERIESICTQSKSSDPLILQIFGVANDALQAEDISEEMSREIDEDLATMALYPTWEREAEQREREEREEREAMAS